MRYKLYQPPPINAFRSREIEFGFSLTNIKTMFESFNAGNNSQKQIGVVS
jgi:hypothetical protein